MVQIPDTTLFINTLATRKINKCEDCKCSGCNECPREIIR